MASMAVPIMKFLEQAFGATNWTVEVATVSLASKNCRLSQVLLILGVSSEAIDSLKPGAWNS